MCVCIFAYMWVNVCAVGAVPLWWMTNDLVCLFAGGGVCGMHACVRCRENSLICADLFTMRWMLMHTWTSLNYQFNQPVHPRQWQKWRGLFESVNLWAYILHTPKKTSTGLQVYDHHPSFHVAHSTFRFVSVKYVISAAVKVKWPASHGTLSMIYKSQWSRKWVRTSPSVCLCHFSAPLSLTQIDSYEKCDLSVV